MRSCSTARHRRRLAAGLEDYAGWLAASLVQDRFGEVRLRWVHDRLRAKAHSQRPSFGFRFRNHDPGTFAGSRRDDAKTDRTGPEDNHGVARVQVVSPDGRVVTAAERLDESTLCPAQVVWEPVQPGLFRDEELGRGAADAEAEMLGADHALADHAVAGRELGHLPAGLDDLPGPFMTGDHGVAERDDVPARQQLDVGMADPDAAAGEEHLVVRDPWNIQIVHCAPTVSEELQDLHRQPHTGVERSGAGRAWGASWLRAGRQRRSQILNRCGHEVKRKSW